MIDPLTFFKAFGVAVVIVALLCGVLYWLFVLYKKFNKNLRFWIKYKVFKRPYKEKHVQKLLTYYDAKTKVEDVKKLLLLRRWPLNKVNEIVWIYKEMIKVKGGNIKNE